MRPTSLKSYTCICLFVYLFFMYGEIVQFKIPCEKFMPADDRTNPTFAEMNFIL